MRIQIITINITPFLSGRPVLIGMCAGDEAKSSESLSDEQLLHIGKPQR